MISVILPLTVTHLDTQLYDTWRETGRYTLTIVVDLM